MTTDAIERHLGLIGKLAADTAMQDTSGMSDLCRARLLTGLEDIRAELARLAETIVPVVRDDGPLFRRA